MSYMTGIITLIVGLAISIALHELGHFVPAKKFGVLTTQYMLGFGPTLWSRRVGETEYGIKAIWLGGFVRMVGMYAPGRPGRRTHNSKGELTLAEQARRDAQAEIPQGAEHRAFYAQPVWKRLIIMVSGTLVNLVLALCCIVLALSIIGAQTPTLRLEQVAADSPAAQAGLLPGDRVLSWNEEEITDWAQLQSLIAASPAGKPATIEVFRSPGALEQGHAAISRDATGTSKPEPVAKTHFENLVTQEITPATAPGENRSIVGIMPAWQRQTIGLGQSVLYTASMGWETAKILAVLPLKLWDTAVSLLHPNQPRDPNSVMGLIGMGQVAGQISSTEASGYGLADKAVSFLMLFGSLNMTLFMFNLIPLMPLDGGQAAGALWEAARDGWRRFRGRPPLGAVDLARLLPITLTVVMCFIGMTVLLIVADILKPM